MIMKRRKCNVRVVDTTQKAKAGEIPNQLKMSQGSPWVWITAHRKISSPHRCQPQGCPASLVFLRKSLWLLTYSPLSLFLLTPWHSCYVSCKGISQGERFNRWNSQSESSNIVFIVFLWMKHTNLPSIKQHFLIKTACSLHHTVNWQFASFVTVPTPIKFLILYGTDVIYILNSTWQVYHQKVWYIVLNYLEIEIKNNGFLISDGWRWKQESYF